MSAGGLSGSANASLSGHLRMRLLLVPLGRVPEEKMRHYAQQVRAVARCIDFSSLNTNSLPRDSMAFRCFLANCFMCALLISIFALLDSYVLRFNQLPLSVAPVLCGLTIAAISV